MSIRVRDRGAVEYMRSLARMVPEEKRHSLTVKNGMDYAETLHNREGYYVFNDDKMLEIVTDWLEELVESDAELDVAMALDGAGFEYVNFLRSYVPGTNPPVRESEGVRQPHPGGWSDITNNLRNAYRHRVNRGNFHSDAEYENSGS